MNSEAFMMTGMLMFVIVFYGIILLITLGNYILQAVGILQVSKRLGQEYGWLGFIPIAKEYQLGKLAGSIEMGKRTVRKPGLWLALLPVIVYGVAFTLYFVMIFSMSFSMASAFDNPSNLEGMFVTMIGVVIVFYLIIIIGAIVMQLFRLMVLHRIFSYFHEGQRPVFHMLLCAFVPLAEGILLIKTASKPVRYLPEYMQAIPYYPWEQPLYTQEQGQTQQPMNGPGVPPPPPYPSGPSDAAPDDPTHRDPPHFQ